MRGNSLLTLSLLAAALLAGCSGSGGAKDPEPTDDLGLEATDDTGIIRGVVFDEAIVPIEGAHVTISVPGGEDLVGDTLPNGAFGFDELDPGTYFVKVSKVGFITTQQSTEVEAGIDDPRMVRILLEADPAAIQPYAQTYVFEGFLECSTPVFGFCGFVTDAAELGGIDNATAENSQVRYDIEGRPMWVQSEMLWDPTNEAGKRLALMYSYGDCGGGFYCDHLVAGESPLLLAADQEKVDEIGLGNNTELYIRVFSEGLEESGGLAGATLEQDVTIYTTVFYGYAPPEGWRFSEEQEEPEPPL